VNALIPLPIIVPLLGAALCVIAAPVRWVQRVISLSAMTCNMIVAIVLLVRVDDVDMVVMQAGGWPVPLGITLAVDRLSAVMLVVSSLMLLAVMVYAIGQQPRSRGTRRSTRCTSCSRPVCRPASSPVTSSTCSWHSR